MEKLKFTKFFLQVLQHLFIFFKIQLSSRLDFFSINNKDGLIAK
jgi:hypothetical protein